ncbi:VanZ family protein [Bremerella sp. JC817]|uniref:VanZ family protein n=1 Tax=Bremerella sp. JC817 TaxID=3231756 RepID=UPI003458BE67
MSLRKLPLLATIVLVALWAIAFTATHWPLRQEPNEILFPHADKIAHMTIYAVLAFVSLLALRAWNYRWTPLLAVLVGLAMVALGMFDELTQMLVAGRTPDPADLLADTIGAGLGIGAYALARAIYARQNYSPSEPR